MDGASVVQERLVACLCAGWCRTCDAYRGTFAAAAREHPGYSFVWVDIEDEADALAPFDLEVENFPTLLVAQGDELRFLGTLTPHAETLRRTIAAAQAGVQPGRAVSDAAGLVRAVRGVGAAV